MGFVTLARWHRLVYKKLWLITTKAEWNAVSGVMKYFAAKTKEHESQCLTYKKPK